MTMIENTITAGTIAPALQTVCSGDAPNLLTSTASPIFTAGATVTYEWQSSSSNLFTTFVGGLADTEQYQPLGVTTTTFFRRVEIIELNNKTCSSTTLPVEVRINTGPGGNLTMGVNGGAASSAATRTICDGDTAIFNITGDGWNGGGAVSNRSYQWMKDGAQVALTNTPTLNYSTFTGVENFFVRVFDRALQNSVTLDPLACESTTNSITVTTVGATAVTLISNATNQTFCSGESIDFEVTFPLPAAVTNYRFVRSAGGEFKILPLLLQH